MTYEIDLAEEAPLAFKHLGSLQIRGRLLTINDIYGDRVHVQHSSTFNAGEPRWNTMWDLKTQRVTSWHPTWTEGRSFVGQVSEELVEMMARRLSPGALGCPVRGTCDHIRHCGSTNHASAQIRIDHPTEPIRSCPQPGSTSIPDIAHAASPRAACPSSFRPRAGRYSTTHKHPIPPDISHTNRDSNCVRRMLAQTCVHWRHSAEWMHLQPLSTGYTRIQVRDTSRRFRGEMFAHRT